METPFLTKSCQNHHHPSAILFVRGSKLGKRTLVWRASVASIAATAITSAVHPDGSQAVAPGTIGPISTGSFVQLPGGGTLSNHIQPSAMVCAGSGTAGLAPAGFWRVSHFQMWSHACQQHHMKITTTTPIRPGSLDICRPRLRHNTRATQGSALVSSTGDSGLPRERRSRRGVGGWWSREAGPALLPWAGQGIVDFGGKGVSNHDHCMAAPCGPTGKRPAGRHHRTESAQRCPHSRHRMTKILYALPSITPSTSCTCIQ